MTDNGKIVTEEEYKGYEISVEYDDGFCSPRNDYPLCSIISSYNKYILGSNDSTSVDAIYELAAECCDSRSDFDNMSVSEAASLINDSGKAIVRSIYYYEHGGISLSLSEYHERFDSGRFGLMYVRRKDLDQQEESCWEGRSEQVMEGELQELECFLNREVYRFTVSDEHGEEVDACGGFYGDADYALSAAKRSVDDTIRLLQQKRREKERKLSSKIDRLIGYTFLGNGGIWYVGSGIFGEASLEYSPANEYGIICGSYRFSQIDEIPDDVLDSMLNASDVVLKKEMKVI